MSKLLIKEPPLQVLPSLAVAIGLNEAIIVQQLHYWLENPKAGVVRDGYKWIHNTYEEWQENFPFWSIPTIQRAILCVEKMGIVISAQLDAKQHDQKKYYRIDYAVLDAMDDIKLMQSKASKRRDVKGTTENTSETIKKDIETPKEIDQVIKAFQDGGVFPNAKTLDYLTFWRETDPKTGERIHTDERIIQAIEAHPGKAQEYIDRVLITWQANGYPKTRQELLIEAKNKQAQQRPQRQNLTDAQSQLREWVQAQGAA